MLAAVESLGPAAFPPDAVVAGHICLDVIPDLSGSSSDLRELMRPGSLSRIGPALLSTGGAVANTGLALHRLGVYTRLLAKVGDDALGRVVRDLVGAEGPGLADGMIVAPGGHTSYTLVISPPGVDRFFLHYAGTNDSYGADDVRADLLRGARLFHFGYPTVMRRLYADGGEELAEIFRRARAAGLTTSLDLTRVDPRSEAARADWPRVLRRVLPLVDVFLPSLDEILFMVGGEVFPAGKDDGAPIDGPRLARLAGALNDLGAPIVGLKLGEQGLYVKTAGAASRLSGIGGASPGDPDRWAGRELLAPCFAVEVAGTTGSGDCTIAGFLTGMLNGLGPVAAMTAAVAAGACCVERPDATSGVPTWDALHRRIQAGWPRRPVDLFLPGWRRDVAGTMWHGPDDRDLQDG